MNTNNKRHGYVGKVYKGKTKYIDPEPKAERRYLIMKDNGEYIGVSKVQSIKKFDKNGKNADKHLIEIDRNYFGLTKRTGIDKELYRYNRQTKKRLKFDNKIFTEFQFDLSDTDLARAKSHVKLRGTKNKKKR